MTTKSTGAKSTRTSGPPGAADTTAAAERSGPDLAKVLEDTAHAMIGFGVIGWNRAQVRRRQLMNLLASQGHQVEHHLDGAREQVATTLRTLDTRLGPVRQDIGTRLDMVSPHLPEPVRTMVQSARNVARETEHQVRQAVGAL